MMKKKIIYVSILMFTITAINYMFQINAGAAFLSKSEDDKEYISAGFSKQQGDCIVFVEPNTFSFGDSIYLYSIKEDKKYLLKRGWTPFERYNDNISILKDKLFFVKWFHWNPESEVNIKSFGTMKEKSYYIGDGYIYGDDCLYGIDYEGVFSVNIDTEKANYLIDFEKYKENDCIIFYDYFKLIDNWIITNIYSDDVPLDKMIFYNIKTKKKIELDLNNLGTKSELIGAFTIIESEKFVFKYYDSKEETKGFLGEFDLKTEKLNIIDNTSEKSGKSYFNNYYMMEMKDNKLYYNDILGDINVYDYKAEESHILIDMNEQLNSIAEKYEVETINAYFCDNYICIDVEYVEIFANNHNFSRQLLIFDYKGNLYKIKRLNSYNEG